MKTKTTSNPGSLLHALFTSLLPIAAVCLSVGTAWTAHAQSDLFASINVAAINGTAQNGAGSIFQYTPAGIQSTFVPNLGSPLGLDRPRGLAFDSAGNLFVAANTFDDNIGDFEGTILKIAPDGMVSTFATGLPAYFFLSGLVTDGAGNVFVMAESDLDTNSASTIYKVTPSGTVSTFGSVQGQPSVPGVGFGLAFDRAGNLFAADAGDKTIYKFSPDGTRSTFVTGSPAFGPTQHPTGLAFDGSGNLFVSTIPFFLETGGDAILKFTPDGTGSTFATGLTTPRGLAFDTVGNLFVAEIPLNTTGDILEFTPGGTKIVPDFASGIGSTAGNSGPEYLAFPPEPVTPVTPVGSNVMVNSGTVGSATDITLTYSGVTVAGRTTVTPIASPSPTPSSSEFQLGTSPLAFDITTTATYTSPIIIAFQVPPPLDVTTLTVLHWNSTTLVWDDVTILDGPFARNTTTNTIYGSVSSLSPFVVAKLRYRAQVQQPINADGTSVFSVRRGVIPVKFTLTQDGAATCTLPAATMALTRTSGGTTGAIDESVYSGSADTGSNFRISSCQYIYNLSASALGVGTYRADIKINGTVVGNAIFQLK